MAGSANFEDTTKPNQSPAAGGFDSERRSSGVSARWLLMQSIKSRRKRYEACDDVVRERRLELPRRLTHAPQTCLSTCSSTLANQLFHYSKLSGFVKSNFQIFLIFSENAGILKI